MDYSSHDLADILERLDQVDIDPGEEAVSTALLRVCLERVPDLPQTLLGVSGVSWLPGGHHSGDIVGKDSEDVVVAHIEIKGPHSQPNRSSSACRRPSCGGGDRLQLEHMLEDGVPVILLSAPHSRCKRWLRRHRQDLVDELREMTWQEVADAIRALPPVYLDPIRSMLGIRSGPAVAG